MPPDLPPAPPPPTDDPQGPVASVPSVPPREKPEPKPRKEPKPRTPPLQKKLEEFFSAPALMFSFTGDDYPAQIVAMRTPMMAEAWYELSKQNAGVKRILERLTEGGAWGMVTISSLAVVVPILQYYDVIPGNDPFAAVMPSPDAAPPARPAQVPPPPPPSPTSGVGEGGGPADAAPVVEDGTVRMTPPVAQGEPPGVVTVAGTGAVTHVQDAA
jgi:hypothetical protein